jgi:hypothetical protein
MTADPIFEDYIAEQDKREHSEEGIAVTATEVMKPTLSSGQCRILQPCRL